MRLIMVTTQLNAAQLNVLRLMSTSVLSRSNRNYRTSTIWLLCLKAL